MRTTLALIGTALMLVVGTGISFAQNATLVPPGLLGSAQPAIANSPKSSPIIAFTANGTSTINLTDTHTGACFGVTCSSSDTCECDVFNGSLTATALGKSSLVLNVTTDDTSGTSNGNNSSDCFPGTGSGTLCNAGGACIGLQTAGTICTSQIAETASTTESTLNANEIFYVQPATGTGKFAGSSGGGNLAIVDDLVINGSSTVISNTGYASMAGAFQKKP